MTREKNTPPAILIVLILVGLLVVLTYLFKFTPLGPIVRHNDISTEQVNTTTESVEWKNPVELPKINIFDFNDGFFLGEKYSAYYVVGKVLKGKYEGGDIVTYLSSNDDFDGPSFGGYAIARFIRRNGVWFFIPSNSTFNLQDKNYTKFVVDHEYVIPGLSAPEFLKSPTGDILVYQPYARNSFELEESKVAVKGMIYPKSYFTDRSSEFVKVFTDETLGDVYMSRKGEFKRGSVSILGQHGFYARLPDGTIATYSLVPPFIEKTGAANIVWNNGEKNIYDFVYTARTGCGSSNFAAVEYNVVLADLVKTGTASNGDSVYELSDKNHKILQQMHKYYAEYSGLTYDQFVAAHPVIFWYDSFGRLIRFENAKYVPQAECGKPVIYLYPTETTNVSVKVAPVGGFSFTEPEHGDGWIVRADTQSNITDLKTGKTYPYLFWEGRGGIYKTPEKGFVVAQKDVHNFLVEKLAALGLNQKETADFLEFWEPRMQGSPYYFITFFGNEAMNQIAPLEVAPKPDTVIRILMDFKPLEKPINVEGFNIRTPERKGFTLVEWGGVIQ